MNPNLISEMRSRVERFSAGRDDRPTLVPLRGRVLEALNLAEQIGTTAKGIRNNVMVPVEGRRKQLQDAVTANLKRIQALENTISDDLRQLDNERRFREKLPAPPNDPVSIQIRAELRAQLRAMPSQDRLAAANFANLDALTIAAILEAPPQLSGLYPAIVEHIRTSLVAAKGVPDFSAADTEMTVLAKAALETARSVAGEESEMPERDFVSRAAGIKIEMTAGIDRSDADLATLVTIAKEAA